ncbi:hypothetical protein [Mediterraneibacter gnavus]|uniref:hypothetical protein n=1 Tax=Mediterraneibacter gnavus TaxID=33038 RepID=UPI00232C03D0|nr:hypothetical protein [Mediterraneibacter gnavus]MDB8683580.1 hypothetical protein [Mediterraneibacter gnavus]MDB8694026.1 hypothetical protein [Mediterraneibacter gnavus]MDB8701020.1 hypothetical protein [Mediterraneibacter gnavus]
MLKMVDGTGIIGVDMVCPLGVSTPQPPNYDRVELEGTGMLVLPNSLDAPLERLELGGKTEQVQTSGNQMLNEELLKSLSNYTSNGSDYYYHRISGLEVGKKYTISRGYVKTGKNALLGISVNQESTNKAKFLVYDGLGTGYNNASITWEQTTGEYVDILFSVSGSVTSTTQERLSEFWERLSYVQLEKGTTATPYEPYTGGKPSPSPEYPQEIVNAGKLNEDTGKYEVIVDKYGKNLFDKYMALPKSSYDIQSGPYWRKYFYLPPNTKYRVRTFNNSIKPPLSSVDLFLGPVTKDGTYDNADANGIISLFPSDHYDKNIAFSTDETGKMVLKIVSYANETNVKKMLDNVHIMVYKNGLDDTIEQYIAPKSFTLTSDRPITKWDRLVEQGGEIGWLYAGVVIDRFDGQSNKISIANKQGNVQNFSIRFENVANGSGNSDIFVDKYRAVQLSYTKAEYGICCNWNDGVKYFSAPNENVATVDEFKAWLVENPLKIAYETTKTEFIPLPQSEQDAIRALKTYYPTTVITVDGGELDPDIKVTYRKEI